jgi:YVTN family beta-propeller protein
MKKNLTKWIIPALVILSSCKNDDTVPAPGVELEPAQGVYVLSEGNIGGNNTRLGFYTIAANTFSGNYYMQQNPASATDLGDTGNDAIIYGGKMYIVMNGSGNVIVLNAATGTFLQSIPFVNGTNNKSPRYAIGAKGKVFVSAFDNTVSVVDTSTLAITHTIAVGANPEGIATSGNYLYVANSGSGNYPDFDSTVSVVDLNTLTEIKKIRVGINPNKVEVNSTGDVYVSAYGDYGAAPASISVISSATNTLKTTLGAGFGYSHLRISGDIAYLYNNYGGTGTCKIYNTVTNTVVRPEFITDGTVIATPYGINIDEENGDVYITDAKDYSSAGEVVCFDKTGKKKFAFSTAPGVNPNKVLFRR